MATEGTSKPTTTKGYPYTVWYEPPIGGEERRQLVHLADVTAANVDEAIELAGEKGGFPKLDGVRCIAVPSSYWHERDVEVTMVPTVRVTKPKPPPTGPGKV